MNIIPANKIIDQGGSYIDTVANSLSKVALVRGPIVYASGSMNNEATPAIGLAYIAGYLKKYNYDPVIIDSIGEGLNKTWPLKDYPGFNGHGLTFDKIISNIPKDSNIIGFSGMFSGEWPVLRDLINEIRENFPDALFIAGGEHVTALPEYSLRDCPALDVIVLGEGEKTFYELIKQYDTIGSHKDIYGTAYLNNGTYIQPPKPVVRKGENINDPSRISDANEIPWPYWPIGHLEKFWDANKSFGVFTGRDMPFLLSRGCPYECTFCSNPLMYGNKYVLRDIDDVISEIKFYIEKYDITAITLYDLTAITKKSWIVEFCKRLIKEDIKLNWSLPSGTRSEVLDAEVLELLKITGCNYLVYAPESGSVETLKRIKKQVDLDNLTKSVLSAKTNKIITRINLIIGFPGESWYDIFKTFLFGFKMALKGVDEVPLYLYSAYPGTELYDGLVNDNQIELGDPYFLALTRIGDHLATNITGFNNSVNQRLLAITRTTFMITNYFIGYLFYPSRIYRTIKNLYLNNNAATVLENRLNDVYNKIKYKLS